MNKTLSFLIAVIMIAAAIAIALPVSAATAFSDVEDDCWSASSIAYAFN